MFVNSHMECGICHEVFKDPRIMPCGHTFCLTCLQQLESTSQSQASSTRRIDCPYCRTPFSTVGQSVQTLPKNYTIDECISSLPAMNQCVLIGDGNTHGKVEHFCFDCWEPLCASCSAVHTRTRQTKDHKVKTLADATQDDIQKRTQQASLHCSVHKQQIITLYCKTCEQMGCNTCAVMKHRNHECLEIEDADQGFVAQIKTSLQPLLELNSQYDSEVQAISGAIKTLAIDHDKLQTDVKNVLVKTENDLRTQFEQLMKQLNACKDSVLQTFQEQKQHQTDKLNAQLANKVKAVRDIKQKISTCENSLSPSSTVFDRSNFVKQLSSSAINNNASVEQMEMLNLNDEAAKWRGKLTEWQKGITDVLTTSATTIIQLKLKPLDFVAVQR